MSYECIAQLEKIVQSQNHACEAIVPVHLGKTLQDLNFRGFTQTWISFQENPRVEPHFFADICVVSNDEELKLACKFNSSHIFCIDKMTFSLKDKNHFQYRSKDHVNETFKHQERVPFKVRCALVRAIFSSKGRLCDTLDISKDPQMPSFLFTDRPDLISQTVKDKINVVFIPNAFTKPQLAAKHVKWNSHLYLPTQDCVLWVDGFMAPDKELPWLDQMHSFTILSKQEDHKNRFCVSLRKQIYNRLNAYSENDECLRCKRITKEMRDLGDDFLQSNELDRSKSMQIQWTSLCIKANRHFQTIQISEELFSILQQVHQRDQVFLPVVLYKHKTDVLCYLPDVCDQVLGVHNVEVGPQ